MEEQGSKCSDCGNAIAKKEYTYHDLFYCDRCYKDYKIKTNYDYSEDCCDTQNLKYVRFIMSNGADAVRAQCFSCGYLHGKFYPKLSIAIYKSLQMWSETMREAYYEKRKTLGISISKEFSEITEWIRDKKFEAITSDEDSDYKNYLRSDQWKEKRLLVLKRDKHICQSCMVSKAQDVHHLTYQFIYNEPLFTLVSVCRPCHEAIELMKDKKECKNILHKKA